MLKIALGRGLRLLGNWRRRPGRAAANPDAPGRMHASARRPLSNLPMAASGLIGREVAVQRVLGLLSGSRLVTLTGPGGIGKSALALEVAMRLLPAFHGEVWLVGLASLSDPGSMPSAVAGILGLRPGDIGSTAAVARAIGDRKVMLVLDDCEHVIYAAADMAETLVRFCPHASVLTTSREVLRAEGELVYHVAPLDVPAPDQDAAADAPGCSAMQLLIARMRALRPDSAVRGDNIPVLAAICRRLDGIPLALELAAVRAATLGVRDVVAGLDDPFAFLTVGRRTAPPRHHSLRALLDWSYALLPTDEQRLLRRLGSFPAGFTLIEAATRMDSTLPVVAGAVSNLVLKSLVTLDGSGPDMRWRLPGTIRAYALGKFAASGEAE